MGTIDYQRSGEVIEITIRDSSGAKIERHVCNMRDKKKYASILKYLQDKYGFSPETNPTSPVNWWD
jgi:hypothetical protein